MLHGRKYLTIARISLRNAWAYRAGTAFRLILYALYVFVLFCVWKAVYRGGEIAGFSLTQMVWYVSLTEFIVFGCRTGIFGDLNEDIKSGDIAYQLNRPYHFLAYQAANALGETAVNSCFYLLAAIALGLALAGPLPHFALWQLPPIALSMALGMALNFLSMMALGLTAFYLEENTAFFLIWSKLVFKLGMFLPVEFLPDWLQTVARSLPFSYIAWAPARLAVSFDWAHFAATVPLQALWVVLLAGLSVLLYGKGVKRIHANGG